MGSSRRGLTPLQLQVLGAFKNLDDTWLTGGAALAGFYLHHRRSKDLDLFTAERTRLDELETYRDRLVRALQERGWPRR